MDIYVLDLNFQDTPNAIAAYLVVGPSGPALVETGPASTLSVLEARLAEHGYTTADIRDVLVTHIHLDHAGAAGWWARRGARVYVHHVGARHLIDPSRLLTSAERIYGDAMDRLWGKTLPAPEEQVHPLRDGDTIEVCGLRFIALDTPGHAKHHVVYQLGDVAFTGDVGAVRLQQSQFISLPAPPPEYDREVWQTTLMRLRGIDLTTIYPTHYGPVSDVDLHFQALSELIDQATEFVHVRMQAGMGRDALAKEYLAWARDRAAAHGVSAKESQALDLANPTLMSVDGITRYWRKKGDS